MASRLKRLLIVLSVVLSQVFGFFATSSSFADTEPELSLKVNFIGSEISRDAIQRIRVYAEVWSLDPYEDYCRYLLGESYAPFNSLEEIVLKQPACPDPEDPDSLIVQNEVFLEIKMKPEVNLGSYETATFQMKFPFRFIINWSRDIQLDLKLAMPKNYEVRLPSNRKVPLWPGPRPNIDFANSSSKISFFPIQQECKYDWNRYEPRWPQSVEYFKPMKCLRTKFPLGPIKSYKFLNPKYKSVKLFTYGCPSWDFDPFFSMVRAGWKAKISWQTSGQFVINRIFSIFAPTPHTPQAFSYPCANLPQPLIYNFPEDAMNIGSNSINVTAYRGDYNVLAAVKLRSDYDDFPVVGRLQLRKSRISDIQDFDCIHKYWAFVETDWGGVHTWAENENWGRSWC